MKRFLNSQRGFTLAELLVAMGLLTVITSTIGVGMFQAQKTQQGVVREGLAINEVRKGLSWLAEDVKQASSTDLVDSAAAVFSLTLTWTDQFADANVTHTITYNLVGSDLVRNMDGASHIVARKVVSVEFTLSNRTVSALLVTDSGQGATKTRRVNSVMRSIEL